jgi:hypothetical protein
VISGFTGEVTEVKSFVEGLGLNKAPEPPQISQDEQDALNRIAGIPTGDGGAAPNDTADGNARLKAISDQATREKWGRARFEDEFTAEMTRQRRPVTQFQDVQVIRGGQLPGTP